MASNSPRGGDPTGKEFREHCGYLVLSSEVGRTHVGLKCPFCAATVLAYLWSLAGSGKRCECGAVCTQVGAWRRVVVPA